MHAGSRLGTPEVLAIMLAEGLEDDSARRGVDSHGEGLRGEQHLDEAPAEQHLDHLLHYWQQSCPHINHVRWQHITIPDSTAGARCIEADRAVAALTILHLQGSIQERQNDLKTSDILESSTLSLLTN